MLIKINKWRPYVEARKLAQSLKLKSRAQWNAWTKTSKRPADIPTAPWRTYKGQGWRGWRIFWERTP